MPDSKKEVYAAYARRASGPILIVADCVRRVPAEMVSRPNNPIAIEMDEWLIFELDGREVYRWRVSQMDGWCKLSFGDDLQQLPAGP